MKITNTYGLPQTMVKALSWQHKPASGLTVTELINPPRIAQLTRRHWDEIEVDISEMMWLLLGTSVHYILERGELPESLVEEKLSTVWNGVELRGRSDLWYQRILYDYKVTSVWTAVYEPKGRMDWHRAENIYKWLYDLQGFESDAIRVPAILRDWEKRKARQDIKYPAIPFVMFDIPIWSREQVVRYVDSRVTAHLQAAQLPDDQLPPCSDEERWIRGNKYAIMKRGKKRAVKVCDSLDEAKANLPTDPIYNIEERLGEPTRCLDYCNVSEFCSQFSEFYSQCKVGNNEVLP
jgi:hypothetical protein